ncbi:hypothetical protein D3C76_1724690 [compost metagenome]
MASGAWKFFASELAPTGQHNSASAVVSRVMCSAVVVSPGVMRMHGPQAAPLRTTVNRL